MSAENIERAFSEIDRSDFLPDAVRANAYHDIPLTIGYGQTNSQPSTVTFMLELLRPAAGQRILDVGSGSGWTTALLSSAVGKTGRVTALERIPELLEMGRLNVEKYGFLSEGRTRMLLGDGWKGFPPEAPYDRILVSAMADRIPDALAVQLEIGGILVVPVFNDICRIIKTGNETYEREDYCGFVFVPLVKESH
jgi:protein-L-isoaspartate(D-aspartate) O-methyltransferase